MNASAWKEIEQLKLEKEQTEKVSDSQTLSQDSSLNNRAHKAEKDPSQSSRTCAHEVGGYSSQRPRTPNPKSSKGIDKGKETGTLSLSSPSVSSDSSEQPSNPFRSPTRSKLPFGQSSSDPNDRHACRPNPACSPPLCSRLIGGV